MKVSVSIDKKIVDNVKNFCKLNGKNYLEYITEAIEGKLAVDMYGDLNDKIKSKDKPKMQKAEDFIKEKTKKEEIPVKTEEVFDEIPLITDEPLSISEGEIRDISSMSDLNSKEIVKPKTTKRILKSK